MKTIDQGQEKCVNSKYKAISQSSIKHNLELKEWLLLRAVLYESGLRSKCESSCIPDCVWSLYTCPDIQYETWEKKCYFAAQWKKALHFPKKSDYKTIIYSVLRVNLFMHIINDDDMNIWLKFRWIKAKT